MVKILELPNTTITCKSGEDIIAQVNATLRFNFEGCSEAKLAKDASGNGWVVKAQSMFRSAIMATRKEDYDGPTIEAIKEDWAVKEFNILEDFKERGKVDKVARATKDFEARSPDQRAAFLEMLQATTDELEAGLIDAS